MEQSINNIWNDLRNLQAAASKLAKLIDSEQQAIREADFDAVEAVLRQKQVILDQLSGFQELKESFARAAGSLDNLHFSHAVRQLEEQLIALSRREESTLQLMKEHHGKLSNELRALSQSQQAASPYSRTSQTGLKSRIDISS